MPNDPRLKFKKKVYDASRNIIYFQGSGGGGRLRSIYEDGTPTDEGGGDTGGGGTGGGGGGVVPYTPRDIPVIPQPIKPTLDPGAISGITIGSVAAAAALTEAARRTLNAQRQRQQGFAEISQKDLSSRQSGSSSRTTSKRAAARGASGAISRAIEMMTPTRPSGPIPAQFAPLSVESSPSSSGTATPSSGELTSLRPSARGFQQQPSALAALAATPPPNVPERPNAPLNLQQEIEAKQLEIRMPTTSGGRIKTLQNEIRILEEQIRASGVPYTSLEERINLAVNTPLSKPAPAPAPDLQRATSRGNNILVIPEQKPSTTIADRIAQMKAQGKSQAQIDAAVDAIRANQARKGIDLKQQLRIREIELQNVGNTPEINIQLQKDIETLRNQIVIDEIEVIKGKQQRSSEALRITESDLSKPNVPKQATYLKKMKTYNLNKLQKQVEDIELKLLNIQMPIEQRRALVAEQEGYRKQIEEVRGSRINKTITSEVNTSVSAPANDNIRATQPTRELRPAASAPEIEMGSRAQIVSTEPSTAGKAALERARTAQQKLSTDRPAPSAATTLLDEGAGLGIGSGREALGMSNEEFANRLEQARIQSEREIPVALDPKKSETLARERQMMEYMREGDAEAEFSRQIAEAERQSLIEAERAPVERLAPAVRTETAVDRFNKIYDTMIEGHRAAGFEIPTAPEGMTGIERQKHIMDEIIRETDRAGNKITEAIDTPKERILTPEEAFAKIETEYTKALNDPNTRRPVEAIAPEEHIGTAVPKGKKGKLTKKTGLLATEEQRLRPTALASEAQGRVRAGAPVERAAPAEARVAAPAPEARAAAAPEITARAAAAPEARAAPAPEIQARRRLGVPELTAPLPAPPEERASFAERQAFFEETSRRVAPPTETPTPSAPPSAPGTETATPREGIIREQTPAERAAFAEEVSLGLKGKKVPGRQKAKINSGKTNKATLNPLEKFVGPQFRNTPNLEIHPSAKNLRGALAELGSRVPKLVPSKKVLMSAGANFVAEAGGMVTGFFAGSEAGKAMNKYFATHPPTNRTDEYGQALATSMVALGVGNLVSKAVTYAIKQGARIAMGAELTGSISGAGIAGASAVFEAGVFATVATTTQFFITKALEDAGNSHAYSRTMGSIYATEALMYTEVAMWLGKGGPVNLAGDVSFLASELFIIGFGIWSAFEEFTEGKKEDENEAALREEERLERARAEQERRDTVAAINRTNAAKAAFLQRLPLWDYDFDALYARLTDKEKQELGITSPETKLAFQKDVERAFDPFGAFQKSDNGLVQDPPIQTQVEKDRSEVMNSYINWYIDELRGVRHEPFNFDDPKVRELNEYSGGTWKSAAQVSASTNHLQAERVHPLIERAQNEIIDAFHNERKTIEQMDELTVRYATLDPTFRANYEAYIITDAAAQILVEFNNTQSTYNEVDPALLAIADRDPNFRAAADAYYQVLANQARDYQLTISEVAHLNSLMENEQEIELGKLNEARNRIIDKNQAENQAMVDAYNANILREINIYGDNFEAIIRNINEQSLLSGHTFLYASNRADLYRQLHLEVPEIEFVDPVDEIDGKRPDATWHQGKGRKAGDTAIYHYRYNLTDEQNQEIEDLIASNQISRFDAEKQALIIYNRDRAKFVQTDEEKAADLGLSLDAYYKKFGIVDPTVISTEPTYKDLQILYPEQYRNLRQKYANDPDADSKIEETLARAHKRRMEESGGIYTPLEQAPDLKVEQLQQMYPDFYESIAKNVRNKDGSLSPESVKFLEISLRMHHELAVEAGTAPPVPVETRDPTYEELQLMYPEQFDIYNDANTAIGQEDKTEAMLRRLHRRRTEAGTAPPLPEPTIVIDPTLKNGIVNMPDGSTRTYRNGLVVNVLYRNADEMKLTDFKNAQEINAAEGVQKSDYTPTKTAATTLRQGVLTMPDGSKRFYVDGKVVSVDYPEGVQGKTIKEINDAEGINSVPIANQAVDPGGLPTQIQTPTELTYEQLQVMYPDRYQQYTKSYANAGNYNINVPSPEEQATMIEGLLRAEHENRTQAGTAPPAPTPTTTTTTTPTTNQPLPMVPGARSFEYADSGTQAAPATNP